jgi:phosphodiesterase/alkaline phosphatase D-like protein
VNAGTTLHYGTDPSHLDLAAGMPWGGLTHRVTLKDLKPNTTYYFRAESSQGQGTGTQAQTEQTSFQTKPAGVSSQLK